MTLDTFVKNTLKNIAKGVKDANSEEKSFALKNSSWFKDKSNGCIAFDLLVENINDKIEVITSRPKTSDNSHRVKFNVTQINSIS